MNNAKTPRKHQAQWQLIFSGSDTVQDSIGSVEENLDKIEEERSSQDKTKWPSAYVTVFEDMVKTVLNEEHELLSSQEVDLLENFSLLSYNARYCLVRLVLRKADQWHPLSALASYEKALGPDYVLPAISDLCRPIEHILHQPYNDTPPKMEEDIPTLPASPPARIPDTTSDGHEIIDLTMDSDEEEGKKPVVGLSPMNVWHEEEASKSRIMTDEERLRALLDPSEDEETLDRFCEDETYMTTHEILDRLSIPQLKGLGKGMRCKFKPNCKKSDMIYILQCNAATQYVLPNYSSISSVKEKGKAEDHLIQSQLSFAAARPNNKRKTTQEEHLKKMALKELGKCVRVKHGFYRLVRRLHIICYRETEHPTSFLLPALLTTFKKRDYTGYKCTRSNNIWASRDELLAYERALELKSLLDDLIEASEDKSARRNTKTPSARVKDKFTTPVNEGAAASYTTLLRTPGSISNTKASKTPHLKKEEEMDDDAAALDDVDPEGSIVLEISKEEEIKMHLEDWIYPHWRKFFNQRRAEGVRSKPPGLERFESGHVFTRMLHKATKALGILKEYKLELQVINDLLCQTFWRRSKRAQWYERRAIILGHLTRQAVTKEAKRELLIQSLEGVKEALQDEDTTLVFRPGLVKRLLSLEIKLGIPLCERSRSDGKLEPAPETTLMATRIYPPEFDRLGLQKENAQAGLHGYVAVTKSNSTSASKPLEPEVTKKKPGRKSSWNGRNGETVNVEQRALEYYEDQGFKGFHCETRILTTIFALLFWDIIFADVPGAFETSYQAAPLDMFEETFKDARKELIDRRIEEIKNGGWREIAEKHDSAYREKKTWCIGISWDLCAREEFLDILECFGGHSLATICQHFCEDYKGRSSGGPDLFIWKKEGERGGVCKFVEVKGPGDSPQANQKVWFDCLHRAKVSVEICWVKDNTQPQSGPNVSSTKKRKSRTASVSVGPSRRRKGPKVESISDEEDYDRLDPEPEEGADFLLPHPPDQSSAKRRRLSPRSYSLGLPAGVIPFSKSASSHSVYTMSPSRLPKPTKVEST